MAGRVIDVKVQLGDRVVPQQELAVIYVAGTRRTRLDGTEVRPATWANGPIDENQIRFQRAGDEVAERPAAQIRALAVPVAGPQSDTLLSLRAPIGGTVIELRTRLGGPLSLPVSMMSIANLDTIWVTMSVPTADVALRLMGHRAEIRFPAYPDQYFTSEPRPIGSASEKQVPIRKLEFTLQNPNACLKLNMSASARFSGLKETAAIIPAAALVSNRRIVFVEVEPWTFEARAVTLDRLEGGQAIVANGVKVGERIVSRGAALLLSPQPE